MRTARIPRRVSAALVIVAMVTAACGDDDTASPASTAAPALSTSASTSPPSETPSSSAAPESSSSASASSAVEATSSSLAEVVVGPGVDEASKTITVASLSALTPPFDIIGVPGTAGQRAYFEALNEAGGIDGWTIELLEADSQYNPQLHKQLYEELRDGIALVSQSVGSPTTAAIVDDIIADEMTVLPTSLATGLCRIANMVPFGTPYQLDVINGFQWLVDEQGAQSGQRTAVVYQDDEYGQDALAGYRTATEEFGFESAGEFTYARTDTDFTALVQSLQASGAEYVQLTSTPSQTGPIIAQSAQVGFTPTWLLSFPSWDEALLTRAGIPAEAFANAYVVTSLAPWGEEGVPGMADMLAASETYTPDQTPSNFYVVGYAQGKIVAELLGIAIERGDLSRAGILAAASELTSIEMEGFVPDISISASDRIPSRESSVFQIDPEAPSSIRRIADLFASPVAEEVTCS